MSRSRTKVNKTYNNSLGCDDTKCITAFALKDSKWIVYQRLYICIQNNYCNLFFGSSIFEMQIKPFFVIICLYRAFGNGLTAIGVETE